MLDNVVLAFDQAVDDVQQFVIWPLDSTLQQDEELATLFHEMAKDKALAMKAVSVYHNAVMALVTKAETDFGPEDREYLVIDLAKLVPELYAVVFKDLSTWEADTTTVAYLSHIVEDTVKVLDTFKFLQSRLVLPEQIRGLRAWLSQDV